MVVVGKISQSVDSLCNCPGGHLPGPKSPSRRSNAGHSTPTKPPTSTVEKTQHNTRHEEPIPGRLVALVMSNINPVCMSHSSRLAPRGA